MTRSLLPLLLLPAFALADRPSLALFADGKRPPDRRLGAVRTLNDKDFFFKPPATLPEWTARRAAVREQLLVTLGLWPMPPAAKVEPPVIHGRIVRDGYSVEKVYFASHPGHYVSGNLYRPLDAKGKPLTGKLPAVLCPHGHWREGRLYDAGEAGGKAQIAGKGEADMAGARYPLQARCAQLAKMGCVVFFFDMVGYADSLAIKHEAFNDVEAELRLQNLMGLQTYNCLRAFDFLSGLPEVDPKRVAVTGASGGGTQTFVLCAIDDRPAAAFPAVMVSTQMQGGCVCENASYLRVGTGNVEFAALFAPKPLAMSGANDWTIDIERKGLPELQAVYKLYGKPENVRAKCWPEFDHNYNRPAREMMYDWFNTHLGLGGKGPIVESAFEPVPPTNLRVFDAKNPRPADAVDAKKLREHLTAVGEKQLAALEPKDAATLEAYRKVMTPALRTMACSSLPEPKEVDARPATAPEIAGATAKAYLLGRTRSGEAVPAILLKGKTFDGTVVVRIHPEGKSSLIDGRRLDPEVAALLAKGCAVLTPDVYGTGELTPEKPMTVNPRFAGYTFGYNRPLLSQRVHDVLTAVGFARKVEGAKRVHLWGVGKAGPWALLARGLCGDAVAKTAIDVDRFRFDGIKDMGDPMMLPGALKYGGLPALAGLAAPGELLLHNHRGTGLGKWVKATYKAAGAESKLKTSGDAMTPAQVFAWLTNS